MPEISPSKYLVQASWADVPHLSQKDKRELRASTEPHLLSAVTEGVPSLGAGAIYPIPLDEVLVDPFAIPKHWPRAYGFDVGWNRTAAVWGAIDRDSDVLFLYTEHYRAHAEPSVHSTAIKARGDWIPGVIDPAARGAAQRDGTRLIIEYQELGLNLTMAEKSSSAGIHAVWDRLATGRLRVFRSMRNWQAEYRIYRRTPEGKVVKEHDHLMDATKYLAISGLDMAVVKPADIFRQPVSQLPRLTRAGY